MNKISRAALRVRHQNRLGLVQVARVEQLSPLMRRIILVGETLDGFTSMAADDHVKLFFPAPGQDKPVLPDISSGSVAYPADAVRPAMRDYTPRRFDPQTGELIIEFVLHGHGPAATWASQAAAGQWIGIGGPRGSFLPPEGYPDTLLVGDETALPAIARHLEEMRPGTTAQVLLEVADRDEERHLPSAANAAITWLHRNGAPPGAPELLTDALKNLSLNPADTYASLAGEIEVVRKLRQMLVEERGMTRAQIAAVGYWRIGDPGTEARLEN